jgi:hypothetical protein
MKNEEKKLKVFQALSKPCATIITTRRNNNLGTSCIIRKQT